MDKNTVHLESGCLPREESLAEHGKNTVCEIFSFAVEYVLRQYASYGFVSVIFTIEIHKSN